MSSDGFEGAIFEMNTSGKRPYVTNYADFECTLVAPNSILCANISPGQSTVAVWSVDAKAGVSYMTQTRAGFGVFDGAAAMVGRVLGKCAR